MSLLARIKKSLGGGGKQEQEAASAPAAVPGGGAENAPAEARVGSGAILVALRSKIAELSNGQLIAEDVDPKAILFDFGYVDSLTAVTLISFIDSEYGVSVTELDLVGSLNHLEALAAHIDGARAS